MRYRLELPEICRNSTILAIILVSQFLTVLVWLITDDSFSVNRFGVISLYILWLLLIPSMLVCMLRKVIHAQTFFLGCCLLSFVILLSVACNEWVISLALDIEFNISRTTRVSIVGLLAGFALIWWFGVLDTLKKRSMAESESRVLALQNRIQPHFLFNSLNTISELTVLNPVDAERAISSLSVLFRASLENSRKFHRVGKEIGLCKRYIELQKWRFGEKLEVVWTGDLVSVEASYWEVPKLILQPLLENSIVHGVQKNGAINVIVDVRETGQHISFKIENLIGIEAEKSGHGVAVANIQERLMVLYDDDFRFSDKRDHDRYTVIMRIPKKQCQYVRDTSRNH